MSLINMATKGIIREYFFGKYSAANMAIALIGAKLAGCGNKREINPRIINKIGIMNFVKSFFIFIIFLISNY